MRIVGGAFRGRRLIVPKSNIIRPTADRVRETIFNMIVHKMELEDRIILDLYCGTGALGLEALSRGAEHCVFVDQSREGYQTTMENISNLGAEAKSRLLRGDATQPGKLRLAGTFDLIFMDPPYGKHLAEQSANSLHATGLLSNDGWVVVEEQVRTFPSNLKGLIQKDSRVIGDTQIGFFQQSNS